jgi:tetratricopeptide (TPR) repeat protein
VAKCVAGLPEDRYPSAAALADDLTRYLERRAPLIVRNPSKVEASANFLRRNRVVFAAAAVAVVAVAIGFRVQHAARTWGTEARQSDLLTALDSATECERRGAFDEANSLISGVIDRPGGREAIRTAINASPKSVALRMGLGKAAFLSKDYAEAEAEFLGVLAHVPNHIPALAGLADVQNGLGRHADALASMERAIARYETAKTTPRGYKLIEMRLFAGRQAFYAASALSNQTKYAEAVALFDRALGHFLAIEAAHPDGTIDDRGQYARDIFPAMAYYGRGDAQLGARQFDAAADSLKTAMNYVRRLRNRQKAEDADADFVARVKTDKARADQASKDRRQVAALAAEIYHDKLHVDDARSTARLASGP